MRQFVIAAAVFTAIGITSSIASAQENGFSLSKPMAAPSHALELKVGTGYTQGFGRLSPTRTLPDASGPGIGLGVDVDYRMSPSWSVGLEGQYQELSNQRNASARGVAGNIGATYHLTPTQVGDPFLRLGTGYRYIWENAPDGSRGISIARHGLELASLKAGYDIRISEDVALAPIIGADLNMFLFEKATNQATDALSSPQVATFVYAGLQGRFDLGGSRTGGRTVSYPPEPVMPTSAEITPPPAPPPAPTVPVGPNIAVSPDIFKECSLKLDHSPKFDFDKSDLSSADYDVLAQIADCFLTGPMKGMSLDLVGRADPRGAVKYNDALGLRRAKAVETFLEGRGMSTSDIRAASRGERDAVGTDEVGWAVDRRVDVLSR